MFSRPIGAFAPTFSGFRRISIFGIPCNRLSPRAGPSGACSSRTKDEKVEECPLACDACVTVRIAFFADPVGDDEALKDIHISPARQCAAVAKPVTGSIAILVEENGAPRRCSRKCERVGEDLAENFG